MDDRNIFAVHFQCKSRTIFWVDLNEIYVDSYFQGRIRIWVDVYGWVWMRTSRVEAACIGRVYRWISILTA
jgi:hypothetical protein